MESSTKKRSSARTKKARLESEHALLVAAQAPTVLNGYIDSAEPKADIATGVDAVAQNDGAQNAKPNEEPEPSADAQMPPESVSESGAQLEEIAAAPLPLGATRPGLVLGPLARRLLEESARRGSGKSARTKASHRDLGPAFDAADAKVRSLKARLAEAQEATKTRLDPELSARLTAARGQLRATRGAKVEGVQPFDDAIRQARATLDAAKTAKRDFLTEQGIGAVTMGDGVPSPRQQLRALRVEARQSLEAAGGEELARLRTELRAAKVERKTECERAHAQREAARARPDIPAEATPDADTEAEAGSQSLEGGSE